MMSGRESGENKAPKQDAEALRQDGPIEKLQKEPPPPASVPATGSPSGALLALLTTGDKPCLVLDWHGHVWEANEAARNLLKLSAEELDDSGLLARVPPDQRDLVLTHIRKAVAGGAAEVWAGRVAVGGQPLPLELSFEPIATRAGSADWVLVSLHQPGMTVPAGSIRKKKGFQGDGQTAEARLRGLQKSEAALVQRLEEQRRRIFELEEQLAVRRQTEDRLVTRMHEIEKQIAHRLEEQRQTSADLAAVARFSTLMLQTRVQAVDETIKATLDKGFLPGSIRKMLQEVQAHTAALNRLLVSLVQFAGTTRQPVVLEPIDMTALFRAAAEAVQEQAAAAGCEVRIGKLLPCRGDRNLLQLVAFHLLSNAIQAASSCPCPVVEVSSRTEEKQDGRKKLRDVVWTVRDNGPGFPPNRAHRLFTPMGLTAKPNSPSGAGLGLATARRIVHHLGGRIWAESHEGQGASFSFTVGKPEKLPDEEGA